ncbi:hypothetical protein G7046_g6081 [Stylonectria norvegica]|nr:hypothetical protein G7046_g6081 [Stylonectria norvegica]
MEAAKNAASNITTRPFLRSRAFVVFAAAATVSAVVLKYKAGAITDNEVNQQTDKAPNRYVSVERSGGGI